MVLSTKNNTIQYKWKKKIWSKQDNLNICGQLYWRMEKALGIRAKITKDDSLFRAIRDGYLGKKKYQMNLKE